MFGSLILVLINRCKKLKTPCCLGNCSSQHTVIYRHNIPLKRKQDTVLVRQMYVKQHKKKKKNYMHLSVHFFQIARTPSIHDD